jgi:hypothetical protein
MAFGKREKVPPEQTRVNVRRQVQSPDLSDSGGDEPYAIDPQREPPTGTDEENLPVADLAEDMPALFDREDEDPDRSPETGDDVEIRHRQTRPKQD